MATRVEPSQGLTPEGFVSLGVVVRAHGLRGGLRLHLWNPHGESIRAGVRLRFQLPGGAGARDAVVRRFSPPDLVETDIIQSREAAEALRSAEVPLHREDFSSQDEDDGYLVDYVGAVVVDENGNMLGTIDGFTDNGAQPLALVQVADKTASEPVLVPFVEGIVVRVEKDASGSRVVLNPPVGLFNLNAALEARSDDGDR